MKCYSIAVAHTLEHRLLVVKFSPLVQPYFQSSVVMRPGLALVPLLVVKLGPV